MLGTLPFGTDPNAPPTSPLATPANAAVGLPSPFVPGNQQGLIEMLTRIASGGAAFDAPDRGAGFAGTGLRGPGIADVTRDDMNLGPQAAVAKSFSDLAAPAQTLGNVARGAAFGGPIGAAIGVARSPAGLGLMSNIANFGAIADKAAAYGARGGPAEGGAKNDGRPGSLSPEEAAAQAAAAAATNDMGGPKGGDGGGKGGAAGTGANAESSPGSTAGGDKGDGPGFAAGGLIELMGGGKVARGPGGGMDDLIPTTIDGQRAAALSDGEFVIPADVVSMMGDGSTNAGSKRLYDLVREIREAKTGRDRQASPLQFADVLRRALG